MQAHRDVMWLDDDLHMTTGTAFASEPIDCICAWELKPDPELACTDVSNSLCASQKLARAGLCARADQDTLEPLYHATGAHIEQTDREQRRVTSRPTADTPPPRRVGRRRASKRAREELEMLQREARPKQSQ